PAIARRAAQRTLHVLARGQEVAWPQPRLGLDDRVVEVALAGRVVHRLGLVDGGGARQLDVVVPIEPRGRRAKIGEPIAQIRAEPQIGAAQRSTSTETSSTGSGIGGSGLVARTTTFAALKRSESMSATAVQRRSSVRYDRSVAISATAWQTAL